MGMCARPAVLFLILAHPIQFLERSQVADKEIDAPQLNTLKVH